MTTTAEQLENAAEYIERYGWNSRTNPDPWDGRDPNIPACVMNAIIWANIEESPYEAHRAFIGYRGARSMMEVWNWNDYEATKEQVLRELRACAASLTRQPANTAPTCSPNHYGDRHLYGGFGERCDCDPHWEIRETEPIPADG